MEIELARKGSGTENTAALLELQQEPSLLLAESVLRRMLDEIEERDRSFFEARTCEFRRAGKSSPEENSQEVCQEISAAYAIVASDSKTIKEPISVKDR